MPSLPPLPFQAFDPVPGLACYGALYAAAVGLKGGRLREAEMSWRFDKIRVITEFERLVALSSELDNTLRTRLFQLRSWRDRSDYKPERVTRTDAEVAIEVACHC